MSPFCSSHRTPRADVDPIRSELDALAVVSLAIRRPHAPETIVVLLDHDRRGITVAVITGTVEADAVLDVVECICAAGTGTGRLGAIVVATVRPAGGMVLGDADRWVEACAIADDHGVELVEWFVVGHDVDRPRELVGDGPRW
jgi:hypothetical protein